MIEFYLFAAAMVAVALGFIFYPLYKRNLKAHEQAYTLSNTRLIKQRLIEIDAEYAQGIISKKHQEQAQKELKLALLDETQSPTSSIPKLSKPVSVSLFIALVIAVATVYWHSNQLTGMQRLIDAQAQMNVLTDKIIVNPSQDVSMDDIQDFTLAIRSLIANNAEDATGWMLLGRLYSALSQFEQSYQAFEKSLLIAPNNTETLASYAQALMMPNQLDYLRQAVPVLTKLLSLEPDNNQAALMLAMTSGQVGDVAMSERYFAQVKDLLPANNPAIVQIQARIDELNGQPKVATGFSVTINATAEMNARLAQVNRLQPSYLFVFAKDAQGTNPLPVAVKKLDLRVLPMTVTLTNADAMMASYSLNDISAVKLVARLSFDENVQTSIGELQGTTTITKEPNAVIPVTIMINEEIK